MAVARPAIMPHVSSSGGGDDLGSEDEVKVFKDEGEEEKRSSENLTEDKSDLIDLTESEVRRISSFLHHQTSAPILLIPTLGVPFFSAMFLHFPRLVSPVPYRRRELSACRSRVLQEKSSLAGGSYAPTGKTSARSDLSPVFGESLTPFHALLLREVLHVRFLRRILS